MDAFANSAGGKRGVVRDRLSSLADGLVNDELYSSRIEAIRALAEELQCLEAKERIWALLVQHYGEVVGLGLSSETKLKCLSPWAQALFDNSKVVAFQRDATNSSFNQTTEIALSIRGKDGSVKVVRIYGEYSNRDLKNGDANSLSKLFSDDDEENEYNEDEHDDDDSVPYDDGYSEQTGNARLLGRRPTGGQNRDHEPFDAANETQHAFGNDADEYHNYNDMDDDFSGDYYLGGSDFAGDDGNYEYDGNGNHDEDGDDEDGDDEDDEDDDDDIDQSDDEEDESDDYRHDQEGRTRVDFKLKVLLPGDIKPSVVMALSFTTCTDHRWDAVLYAQETDDEDSEDEKALSENKLMEDPGFYKDFERTGTRDAYGRDRRIVEFQQSREQRLLWALEGRPPAKAASEEYENFCIKEECECRACMMVHGFRTEVDWSVLHALTDIVKDGIDPIPIAPDVLYWFDIRVNHQDDELFRFVRASRVLFFYLAACGGSCGHSYAPLEMFLSIIIPSGVALISGLRRLAFDELSFNSDGSLGID